MASGTGSNAEKLALTAQKQQFNLKGLICDREKAPVLRRMEHLKVPHWAIPLPPRLEGNLAKRKKKHSQSIVELIKRESKGEDVWIFLAGYQRLLSGYFLQHFFDQELKVNRVVNIHPSLLPKYPGLDSYRQTFLAKEKEGGCTVHFVDEGMDTGPVIVQRSFKRRPQITLEEFKKEGLALEHLVYPAVLQTIMSGQFSLDENFNFTSSQEIP